MCFVYNINSFIEDHTKDHFTLFDPTVYSSVMTAFVNYNGIVQKSNAFVMTLFLHFEALPPHCSVHVYVNYGQQKYTYKNCKKECLRGYVHVLLQLAQ